MAILDKAKFLLIPSGYQSAKVYSIFPSSGAFDFTFARTGDDATRQNVSGLIETKGANIPRLNHYNGGCPSLLIEGSATNIQVRSEEFDNAAWTASALAVTVTANQIASPDGTINADKVLRTATSAAYVFDGATKSSAAPLQMTTSIFVKQGEGDYFAIRAQGIFPNKVDARFRFSTKEIYQFDATGTFTAGKKKVEDYGNGWFRLQIEYTTDANASIATLFSPRSSDGIVDSANSTSTSFVYLWGCQVEQSVGATTYIKTEASAVTRDFDDCVNTSTFTLGANATFYFDFEANSFDAYLSQAFNIRNSGFSRFFDLITFEDSDIYYMKMRATSNGGTLNFLIDSGERYILFFQRNKVALKLYQNNYEIYVNGSLVKTGTVTGDFDVLNGEALVSDFAASTPNNTSRKIYAQAIFDETLTTSELTTLTTL